MTGSRFAMNFRRRLARVTLSAFILILLSSVGTRASPAQTADLQDLPPAFPRDGALPLMDNPVGTVWDVTWTPGKHTAMHRHKFDYVGVELTDTSVKLTNLDGSQRTVPLAMGHAFYLPRGITHIEEVPAGSPQRHAIVIDLKDAKKPESPNSRATTTPTMPDSAKKLIDNDRVTMWDFTWPTVQPAIAAVGPKGAFIIFLEAGQLTPANSPDQQPPEAVAPGVVIFTQNGRVFSELSTKGNVHGIVVQLK